MPTNCLPHTLGAVSYARRASNAPAGVLSTSNRKPPLKERDPKPSVVIANLDCTIETAHRFWDYLGYPGEAHVLAEMQVEPLPLLERAGGFQVAYSSCFYERASPRKRAKVLTTDQMTRSVQHGARATANVDERA